MYSSWTFFSYGQMEHPAPCTFPKLASETHNESILVQIWYYSWLPSDYRLFQMFWGVLWCFWMLWSISNRFGTPPHPVSLRNQSISNYLYLAETEGCKVQGVPIMSQNTKYMFQTFQNTKNHRKTPSEHGFININVNLAPDGSQFRAGSWKGMGARPLRIWVFDDKTNCSTTPHKQCRSCDFEGWWDPLRIGTLKTAVRSPPGTT